MYRIGELARLCEVKTDTLRFYEKHGLLIPSARTEAGYRLYTEADTEQLRFILRAKSVGFSLSEITELLSIEKNKADWACVDVKALVDDKIASINVKLQALKNFQLSLQRLSDACCGGPESAVNCSILEALESNNDTIHCENKAHHHDPQHYTKHCCDNSTEHS